ncbi:DHA1 family bicyclomycin/chloramphenicol resistance-like MFS transporter [Roseiarcus fermentans]|uniref:Bcr/CflA family efflux transporter n=1 Tax=Roseiarcus fermentans TaxID=1473586 RepID=A0A366F3K9_9HYPH|nr:multidrug effflux MFS transporter [Roseiarcus fermentans]RBP09187.1 DHA1 family bicyclomycin/chloramphenicol resistance-like MFS transporter [Roseiarcus fermentans]
MKGQGIGFTALLGGLSALPALATDMALPSVGLVQAEFGSSAAEAASAISVFLAGFATAPLAVGPLADRFGRKPVMLGGLALFALAGIACALAPSIAVLIVARVVQGAGAGAVAILPRAIVRDLFEGREARLQLAAVSVVFSVAPLIGPTIGAGLLAMGPWRLIYATLAAVALALGAITLVTLRESHDTELRRSLRPASIAAGYRRALTNRMCGGFSLVVGLVFAGLFAYVNVSPLLFIQGYGASQAAFGGLFAMTASGVIAGSLLNTWLVRRHTSPRRVLDGALAAIALAGLTVLVASLFGHPSLVFVIAPVMIYISAFGLIMPNAVHEAIHPLPDIAGVASAVLVSAQMLFGAVGGSLAASLYRDASPLAIGVVMSAGGISAAAVYVVWLRRGVEA